jgi:hypothetical protein
VPSSNCTSEEKMNMGIVQWLFCCCTFHSTVRSESRCAQVHNSGVPREGELEGLTPLRNSEVLTKLSQIPSSVENTSVTTK